MRSEKRQSLRKARFREWGKALITAFVVALIIAQFVMPTIIYGSSMEPSFQHNELILVSKQAYNTHRKPERGDVIIFESELPDEDGNDQLLIKRVIGLPGETIEIKDGRVYIDGRELGESYTKDGYTNGIIEPRVIPDDGYFCMGDNRLRSRDSRDRTVGIVYTDEIEGKVFFKLYPFSKFGKTA